MAARTIAVKKRKLQSSHSYLDLDDPEVEAASHFPPEILKTLPESLEPLRPILQLVSDALSNKHVGSTEKVYQAGNLTIKNTVAMLGIDYDEESIDYIWVLTSDGVEQGKGINLSSWANAIDVIKKSRYFTLHHPETLTRTIIDILLCDRLGALDDDESNRHLHVASEVNIHTSIQNEMIYGRGYVSGRADWTLGYGTDKAELETVLAVIEAKKGGHTSSAIAQMLSYLAGVQDARKTARKINYDIFGVATDSKTFHFVVLRSNRRAYVSEPLLWVTRRSTIITFFDHILRKAIESSPHNTSKNCKQTHHEIRQASKTDCHVWVKRGI